jgi:hypothetical protein
MKEKLNGINSHWIASNDEKIFIIKAFKRQSFSYLSYPSKTIQLANLHEF